VGQAIEQRGGHLGIAEDGRPFAEGEVGGDDDRGPLLEPADEVEQELAAGRIRPIVSTTNIPHHPLLRKAGRLLRQLLNGGSILDADPPPQGVNFRRPPADKPLAVDGKSWPILMAFTRGGLPKQKPLFAFSARLFESGILDHVTVDADVVTITADLQALEMRAPASCR
jgi:hypothetical protein